MTNYTQKEKDQAFLSGASCILFIVVTIGLIIAGALGWLK